MTSSAEGTILNVFQHILKRPKGYIGIPKTFKVERWVYDSKTSKIVLKKVRDNAALNKIIGEIYSNAIDNKWRSEKKKVKMTKIDIGIDSKTGEIEISNDGCAIPCGKKQKYPYKNETTGETIVYEMYPAELFFGSPNAGTNFDDDEKKKTSGTYGIGAKAANIFSTRFEVSVGDAESRKQFNQVFTKNATKRTEAVVKAYSNKTSYVSIKFIPDYLSLGYTTSGNRDEGESLGIDKDLISQIKKWAYDIAMFTGLAVNLTIDGESEKIKVANMAKYSQLYFPESKAIHFVAKDISEAVLVETFSDDCPEKLDTIPHVSFVNGICTTEGGEHVKAWSSAIITSLVKAYNEKKAKKTKKGDTAPPKIASADLYPYFTLFIKCEVDNQDFKGLTKEFYFGEKPKTVKPDEKEVQKIFKWDFVKALENKLLAKIDKKLSKGEGAKTKKMLLGGKGSDATWAGKAKKAECMLFLTEGNSAKSTIDSGIQSVDDGPQKYGSLALRGKVINASTASATKLNENEEIKLLKQMLGLRHGADYSKSEVFAEIRYPKGVCIMADADHDGFHIRGLIMNFFYEEYRTLWDRNFFHDLSTPIIKVICSPKKTVPFFSMDVCKKWWKTNGKKAYEKMYVKGLGTLTAKDGKELMKDPKFIHYFCEGDEDEYMELGFSKDASDLRKEWLARVDDEEEPEIFEGKMALSYFIDRKLVHYSKASNKRSIPSVYDGLKDSQRKVLYTLLTRKGKNTADKVERLAGLVSGTTDYHHGEVSLQGTIVGLAQAFVGTNNIPLLTAEGQFGTRASGGKGKAKTKETAAQTSDVAAARYIFTRLEKITRTLFPEVDDDLLTKTKNEEGKEGEPEWYLPVICFALVNGATGIGTGYSTDVPNFNPKTISSIIRRRLSGNDEDMKEELVPWYLGFKGKITVERDSKGVAKKWFSEGKYSKENGWIKVTELPVGLWTNTFQMHIEKMYVEKIISDFDKGKCGNNEVLRWIKPTNQFDEKKHLKCLKSGGSFTNMVFLNEKDVPQQYEEAIDILNDYFPKRLALYVLRRKTLLAQYKHKLLEASNRARFVVAVYSKKLDLYKTDEEIYAELEEQKYDKLLDSKNIEISESEEETKKKGKEPTYNYLLSMHIRSFTKKKREELEKDVAKYKKMIEELKSKTAEDLWLEDLDQFDEAYEEFLSSHNDRDN